MISIFERAVLHSSGLSNISAWSLPGSGLNQNFSTFVKGVGEGEGDGDGKGEKIGVAVADAEGEGEGNGFGNAVGEADAPGEGFGEAVGLGVGLGDSADGTGRPLSAFPELQPRISKSPNANIVQRLLCELSCMY
ncbi:MAG: hypothetical protein SGI74_07845 [Oligoflexia bacterium]|nr:hypothetical protein [Oligoflexia bacterium]